MKQKRIVDFLMVLMLIIVNLLPGSPLLYNIEISNLLINIVAIIYVGISIRKRQTIKLNKIDILVTVLSLTTLIPLISNKYLSLLDTVHYVLKYMSALNIYFIVKKYTKEESNIDKILKVITFMSTVFILFGIDIMTTNSLSAVYDFLKIPTLGSKNLDRMYSIFKYANTFCAYISMALFLNISLYLKEENVKKKGIYACCIFMQIFGIIVSYSRMCWLIVVALLIVYSIYQKRNGKSINKLIRISLVNGFVYYSIYTKMCSDGNIPLIWFILIIQNIIQYLIFTNLEKITSKIPTIKIKKWKIYTACVILLSVLITTIYVLTPNELQLFNSKI